MSPVPSPAPLPPPSQNITASARQKQKPFPVGIAAGAEDAKYQAKYKELKRKVKDIESDNDKLHFKVLQAKLSIRRMKMERAVLYERLSVLPPSPNMQDRHPLPPTHSAMSGPPQTTSRSVSASHQHRDHPSSMDPDQLHAFQEHVRPPGNPRLAPGPDGRPVPVMDSSMASTSPHLAVNSPRRISSGHDAGRHHLPPMGQMAPVPNQYNSHASPPLHHPTHPGSSHSRARSHSSSRSRSQNVPMQSYRPPGQHHHYPEPLPPVHQPMHSPPLSERDRPRCGDPHDYAVEPYVYERHQPHLPLSPRTHSSDARSSGRIHSHQRTGPGAYPSREEYHDKPRDLEQQRDREWEQRERNREYTRSREMTSSHMHPHPHPVHRSRSQMDRAGDYDPHLPSPRSRDDPAYYHDSHAPAGYPRLTRSDTPGSGSASGSGAGVADVPSRPDSRSQYYERDRPRSSYRLRPVPQPNEDADFAQHDEGGRSRPDRAAAAGGAGGGSFSVPEQSHPSLDSRKRSRHEMEVDSDNDVADGPSAGGGTLYTSARLQEDRGSKRYHREHHHRRSVDNHEDVRMGPP